MNGQDIENYSRWQRLGGPSYWLTALVVGLAVMIAVGCSDDLEEREFWEPRVMSPYEFDGQPQISGPQLLEFVGVEIEQREVQSLQIRNEGRTALEIEAFVMEGPFELIEEESGERSDKVLLPGQRLGLQVAYEARVEHPEQGVLTIVSNDPQRPEFDVELRATADVPCPTPVITAQSTLGDATADPAGSLEGRPLETVNLSAAQSRAPENREIVEYSWELVDTPEDTMVVLEDPSTSETNRLYLELSGSYVVELDVIDDRGQSGCEPARMVLDAISGDAIHLQLVWDTPTDPDPNNNSGTDLDLHFLHELGNWNRIPYDCNWMNPNPNWGDSGDSSMDPRLDIDEMDGWGPENINLERPEMGVNYSVGVNYFSDSGYGPSYATVRIFLDGVLEHEISGQYMEDNEFWHVADIEWPSRDIEVVDSVTYGFPSN